MSDRAGGEHRAWQRRVTFEELRAHLVAQLISLLARLVKRPQTKRGQQTGGVEWIGGMASLPGYVTGEGEPYRPAMLLWMGAEGAVLGVTTAKPDELLALVDESLRSTIEQPMFGRPHAPTRVRVASPELADALRSSHPKLDVVCAPTPELDELIAMLRQKFGEDESEEQSYLSPGIEPEAIASLFEAAAGLFRAQPWKLVPDDQSLFSATIEQLGVREAAISVIGQMGQSFGIIVFSSFDDFEAYLDAADLIEAGEASKLPPHFALNFERGAELSPALRKEIAAHHWLVAGPSAYPWLVAIDEDLVARPPTAKEVTIAEALARALTKLLAAEQQLRAAWTGGEPVSRTISVPTHAGELEVSLRTPHGRAPHAGDDVLAELAAIARHGDPSDCDAREPLEDELVRRFAASPEAQGLADLGSCRFVMDFAAGYFGETIATLGPMDLREILFVVVPRKVSVDASAARGIIEELRAFYSYLKREHGLAQADACLKVLGGKAVAKLEAALRDSSNFGLAKSLLMAGRDAGFDLDSRASIEAWMQSIQGQPLPAGVQLPLLPPSLAASKPAKQPAKKQAKQPAKKQAKQPAKKQAKQPAKKQTKKPGKRK